MIDTSSPISKFLFASAAFVIVVSGLKMAEPMLVPFLLSVFIAMIVSPLLIWLKKFGIPGWVAILLIVILMLLVGVVLGAVIGSSIQSFRQDLPEYTAKLTAMGASVQQWLAGKGVEINAQQWQDSFDPGALLRLAGSTLASFGNVMTNAMMILLTVIFILAEETGFAEKLRIARGTDSAGDGLREFAASVNSYLGIKTIVSLITGLVIFVWLLIMGVDYAVLWGVLAFMLNFIPTVGSIIAAVPAVLLALVQLGFFHAGMTMLAFVVVNMVMGNIVEPRWMGKGLNLSPLVVFVSLVLWGWVLGPVGMLLSIPLTIMIKIALEHHPETRWIGVMLGSVSTVQAMETSPEQDTSATD